MPKTLEEINKEINKKYGPGTVRAVTDVSVVDVIPTGSLIIDDVTLIGGIPRGRFTEIYGTESSGKTTLALHIAVEAQKLGLTVLYMDVEQSLDLAYAVKLGVNMDKDKFIFAQPSCGEEVLTIAKEYIENAAVGLVIVDSVAAMSPRAELDGDLGDANMGSKARLMGQACRMLQEPVHKNKVAMVFINQLRMNLSTYGSPRFTPGGNALPYASTLRIELARKEKGEVKSDIKAKTVKNKLAPPFREGIFTIEHGYGINILREMAVVGIDKGLWERKGAWYSINEENVAQGIDNMVKYLEGIRESDPLLFDKYLSTCRSSNVG